MVQRPQARWAVQGGWNILADGSRGIARFKGIEWEVRARDGSWIKAKDLTEEVSASETSPWGRLVHEDSDIVIDRHKDGARLRFWSGGRWIEVW